MNAPGDERSSDARDARDDRDDRDHRDSDYPIVRWLVAAIVILYGFAKVTGAQFLVPDSELDRPMGEATGFWLTWYYLGYSPAYKLVIALAEIGGGVLLTTRRYAVLGALVLAPLLLNVVLTDVFFGVGIGPTIIAGLLLAGTLAVLAPHAGRLWQAAVPASSQRAHPAAVVARVAILAGAAWFGYWTLNHTVRFPTAVDGTWRVADGAGEYADVDRVFFEFNRAHMAVFRDTTGEYVRHHFEVTGDSIRIWDAWLQPDSLLLRGVRAGDTIRMRGNGDFVELVRIAGPGERP